MNTGENDSQSRPSDQMNNRQSRERQSTEGERRERAPSRGDRRQGEPSRSTHPRQAAEGRKDRDTREENRVPRERFHDPEIDEDVTFQHLDREVRARLRTLSKESAERVGKHLVMAGRLIDEYPELAYQHAQSALRRAGRVDVVREAAALTAYETGRYNEALREFRTVRRLSGLDIHRAAEADCERGLGRPERALAVIAEAPKSQTMAAQGELAIVAAGARLDMGQPEIALLLVEDAPRTPATGHRLDAMRVELLHALERHGEAEALAATLPEPEVILAFDDLALENDEEPEGEPSSEVEA